MNNLYLIGFGLAAVGVLALLWLLYRKGRKDERSSILVKSAKRLADVKVKQEVRQRKHEKRVEKILSNDLNVDDLGRMLSNYPSENAATAAARSKKS